MDMSLVFSENQQIRGKCDSDILCLGEIGSKVPVPNIASQMQLEVQVTETFKGNETLEVSIVTAENENFADEVTLMSSSLKVSELKAGKKFPFACMPNGIRPYVKLQYQPKGTPTAGRIFAYMTDGQQINLGS